MEIVEELCEHCAFDAATVAADDGGYLITQGDPYFQECDQCGVRTTVHRTLTVIEGDD